MAWLGATMRAQKLLRRIQRNKPEKKTGPAGVVSAETGPSPINRERRSSTVVDTPITPPSDETAKPETAKPETAKANGKPNGQNAQQVQPTTAEDIGNRETVEKLAFEIWAAIVAEKLLNVYSGLVDKLIESPLLDDDDDEEADGEEADEGWFEDHRKREKELLDETITDGLDKYPDIDSINNAVNNAVDNLPLLNSDPKIRAAAEQLKNELGKCPIGATKFKERYPRPQIERRVKIEFERQFKNNPKYSEHIREDVPGRDVKKYGNQRRTSSKGTFYKSANYLDGGGLAALLTGAWMRVAKDRIEPIAGLRKYGLERKTERQSWRRRLLIVERDGTSSRFELPWEELAGNGAPAIRSLMRAYVHIVAGTRAQKGLVRFLKFRPKQEIVRMPRVGWAQVESHGSRGGSHYWIFSRPEEVLTPPDMPAQRKTSYELDTTVTQHGLHVAGTTAEWSAEIAEPLRDNSNIALSLGTFFAAPLLRHASEPGGGNHFCGRSTIGKTMASAVGQSIYGWPFETADDNTFGVSWGGSEAGSAAFLQARTDLGIALDEITALIHVKPRKSSTPLRAEPKAPARKALGSCGRRRTPTCSCCPPARSRSCSLSRAYKRAPASGSSIFRQLRLRLRQ
jgi:hypothetical protein